MEYIYLYTSPLGEITLTSDGSALIGLLFDRQGYFDENVSANLVEKRLPIFEETIKLLDVYFNGYIPDFTPKITIKTTEFRKTVWEILLTIPYGKTMTYGEIAKIMAERKGLTKMSAQAVGGAVGHNPIALIIPCHRVIGANGNLAGYGGGLDRKKFLLNLEKAIIS